MEAALSTLYLTLKYPLEDGRVGVVKDDQGLARKCYKDGLKLKIKAQIDEPVKYYHLKVNHVNIDPRDDPLEDSLTPIEDVKMVPIGNQSSMTTLIGSSMSLEKEVDIIRILRENIDLFAWKLVDMPKIYPNIVCYHLALDLTAKSVSQRKW